MDTALILVADIAPERKWLYQSGIPQSIYRRLSEWGPTQWHAHKPCPRFADPDRAHREYLAQSFLRRTGRRVKRAVKTLRKRVQEPLANPFKQFRHVVRYDETIQQLVALAKVQGAARLALVLDHHVAVSPEGVDLAVGEAQHSQADVVCCTQVEGLLPVVVSVPFLERWLQRDSTPDPRRLWSPASLADLGIVRDLKLVTPDRFPSRIRCGPLDAREMSAPRFWKERAPDLAAALRAHPEAGGAGRERLDALVEDYRAQLVTGLDTYEVVGSLCGVDDVRRRMVATDKPLVDYFVVAMHLGRFLQRYARLRPDSHVVDIGCSWGYFGFVLANFLAGGGAYIGVEVQQSAVDWAQQRMQWLGTNFQFEHLDIYNAFYNPAGTIPRDEVRLPIRNGWADVILAGSVFTHMAEDGVQSYLSEFRRILRPGGIAAFSYDDRSFFGGDGEAIVLDRNVPDKTTLYSREKIKRMVEAGGLRAARMPVNFRLFGRTDFQTWYFAVPDQKD